ncbi:response regulator transcription factor, partial [Myxococcus xanthus]|nr:response regulator transcription factor [Myxococcus xanthus]
GYLLKTIEGDLLADAIGRAARGEPVVSAELMGKLVAAFQAQGGPPAMQAAPPQPVEAPSPGPAAAGEPAAPLSPREEDVLREIARGASNKEIARALDIAETTVKIHVQHILRKLGISSRVQAAVYASDRQRAS